MKKFWIKKKILEYKKICKRWKLWEWKAGSSGGGGGDELRLLSMCLNY